MSGSPNISAGKEATPAPGARRRIGELLVDEGLVKPEQLEEALHKQRTGGGKVVENLIELGYLDSRTFLNFLGRQPGMASIDLLNYEIPREVRELLPAEFALKHELVPIDVMGRDITVAMACPLDAKTIGEIEQMTGKRVRPYLVSLNDVRVALGRYFAPKQESATYHPLGSGAGGAAHTDAPHESALTTEGVAAMVRTVESLPALPEVVGEVRAAIEDPEKAMSDVARVLGRDPSLVAKILGLANSPAYAFAHKVDSVERAVALLGLREVYNVTLSCVVVDYFAEDNPFDYKRFWSRSVFAASAAAVLARQSGFRERGQYFACGLLHDIGRAVFAEVLRKRYVDLHADKDEDTLVAAERATFGVDHPEVGYILAEHWKLPEAIRAAIRYHHAPQEAPRPTTEITITALAALMTDAYGKLTRENVGPFLERCHELLDRIGLDETTFVAALSETAQEAKDNLALMRH